MVVASACPSVQICAISDMRGEMPGKFLNTQLHRLADIGHRGCFHFLNEDGLQLVARLAKIGRVFADFDLIFLDLDSTIAQNVGSLTAFVSRLACDGAFIVAAESLEQFQKAWYELRDISISQPSDLFRSSGETAGMFVKRSERRESGALRDSQESTFDLRPLELLAREVERKAQDPLAVRLLRGTWNAVKKLV